MIWNNWTELMAFDIGMLPFAADEAILCLIHLCFRLMILCFAQCQRLIITVGNSARCRDCDDVRGGLDGWTCGRGDVGCGVLLYVCVMDVMDVE